MTWRRFKTLLDGLPPESLTMTAMRVQRQKEEDQKEFESQYLSKRYGITQMIKSEAENEVRDPSEAPFSKQEMMIADLIDAVRNMTHVLISVNSEQAPQAPEPYPRPGVRNHKKKLAPKRVESIWDMYNSGEDFTDKMHFVEHYGEGALNEKDKEGK